MATSLFPGQCSHLCSRWDGSAAGTRVAGKPGAARGALVWRGKTAAAEPALRAESAPSFPRARARAVLPPRALGHLWACRAGCGGGGGGRAQLTGGRSRPAPGHAPSLRSLSLVLRLRKEVPERRPKTPRGLGWGMVFVTVAWPLKGSPDPIFGT